MSEQNYQLGHTHGSLGMTPSMRDQHYENGYEDAVMKRAYAETKNKPMARAQHQLDKTQEALSHLGAGKPYGAK